MNMDAVRSCLEGNAELVDYTTKLGSSWQEEERRKGFLGKQCYNMNGMPGEND